MTTESEKVSLNAHYALLLLAVIYVLSYIDRLVISVLIEPIKAEFGASDTMIGLLTGVVFALFYTAFGLPLGRLSDRIGRKPVIAVACIAWSILTMLSGVATSFMLLVVLRIGVAVGEAGASAPSVAMISELYPARLRARALAIFGLGPALGAVLGIGFGGVLAEAYGWRMTLIIVGAPGILIGLILALTVKAPKPVTSAAAGVPEEGMLKTAGTLLKIPGLWQIIASGSAAAITGYAIQMWTPSFMIRSHQLNIQEAGMLMGIGGGGLAILGTLVCGYVTDKLAARDAGWQLGTALLGTALSIPLAMAFYLWPAGTAFTLGATSVPTGFLFYMGFAFFGVWWTVPCFSALSRILPANQLAQGTALFFMGVSLLGAGLGPVIAGIISDLLYTLIGAEALRYALVAAASLLLVPCLFLANAIPKFRKQILGAEAARTAVTAAPNSKPATS
ncbi:MFS transporter [Marinobacter sp. X15-166B]|uniref:MFS transporter n=1 Tax=Marinobacter sp. X15-166B TaxID=1897620 RepID=UPI00085C73CD|nr:MFS transporter [Marinobacter sp. X15-166B]OEY66310.1 arabinose ABC transporter permease [Marinobacter sp. X15-166B]